MSDFLPYWTSPVSLKTYNVDIYISGSYAQLRSAAGRYCQKHGYCFSVQKVDYVSTHINPLYDDKDLYYKLKEGAKITLINYPRFPISKNDMNEIAERLGKELAEDMDQSSFTIVDSEDTKWFSRRKDD